jgi:hypothetical protein
MGDCLSEIDVYALDGKVISFADVCDVFFINSQTHGDSEKLAEVAGYDVGEGTLWVNSANVMAVYTK